MSRLPRLIGITGAAGTGKDTLGNYLTERYGYRRQALADPVKELLNKRFGWTMEMWQDRYWKELPQPQAGFHAEEGYESYVYSPRTWAQWLGTEAGRDVHGEDIWIKLLFARWRDAGLPPTVITDVRFDNEANTLRTAGAQIIHLVRSGIVPVVGHASEGGVTRQPGDFVLYNNSSPEHMFLEASAMLQNKYKEVR
jgi:hypothetical protein